MKRVIKTFLGIFLSFSLTLFFLFDAVHAQTLLIATDADVDRNQESLDAQNIDDLLGPDTNFPFDPANHRDNSNPIKRIGKINVDNF
mgnify:CR=1 FL=1